MNINLLFSTPERVTILRQIIYQSGPFRVSNVARETALSKALVSKYLSCLKDEGVVQKQEAQYAVRESVSTRLIRILLTLNEVAEFHFESYPIIKSVGVYGSSAKGLNTERSDLDLWILVSEISDERLAGLTGELKRMLGDAQPLYLTEEKLGVLRREDSPFYYSLICGSITVYGAGFEAI